MHIYTLNHTIALDLCPNPLPNTNLGLDYTQLHLNPLILSSIVLDYQVILVDLQLDYTNNIDLTHNLP